MNKTFKSANCVFAKIRCIVLFLMMFPLGALAQNVNISGTVTDANTGEEVIGATVKVKGAAGGTITDAMGNYKMSVRQGATIEVSYVGYQTKSVKVAGAGKYDIQIAEDVNMLEQVVVVGYGTMKRSDLTGSVSSIDEKAIKQGVNTSIEQAMQGRIAGVQVTQNSGAPGGGISVQIRGINSLSGNEPLYVVDGVAMSGQTDSHTSVMSSLNPADITSIEVLKDASATAIYGSRASNGVVLITTKKGQEGKPVIFLRKIFQQNHLGRASRLLHVVYMELLEVTGHDPAGPLRIGQFRRIALCLLEGSEQRPVRLFDRLHQILFGTLLLNHHMGGRDHAVDEAGVVQVHLVFKGNKLLRFFHAADIAKKGEPEFLAFPLLVAFILPILREFLRGLPGQRVIHFHHLLRGEACRRSPGSSAFPWA